jgi:hypothetical protein
MTPVLARRDLLGNELDKTGKGHATFDGKGHATYTGVIPQATLDLSGPANASGHSNSRGVLELSTLVWTNNVWTFEKKQCFTVQRIKWFRTLRWNIQNYVPYILEHWKMFFSCPWQILVSTFISLVLSGNIIFPVCSSRSVFL